MGGDRDHNQKHKSKSEKSSSKRKDEDFGPSSSLYLIKTLEERRLRDHLERKKLKEELKTNETPTEKRARRILEKQAKEERRRQRMGLTDQHYTNQDNPFGDSNLMSTFLWNKKLEKYGFDKEKDAETVEAMSRHKQFENKVELEKIKKRRMDRELERQAREEENILQQRSKEAAQFQEWERQEDLFHLEQARLRSVIRIQDGRAKPIDLLAQYIANTSLEDSIEMQMHEPYFLLNGLDIKDLEDLLVDIKVYMELEKGKNCDFWDDMTVIVQDELNKLQKPSGSTTSDFVGSRREGIHQNVAKDVSDIFRGKNTAQLEQLRERIEIKITGRRDGVDISYWESLLSQLKAHMARARLRDRHQEKLRQKLQLLKTEEPDFPLPAESPAPHTNKISDPCSDDTEEANPQANVEINQSNICSDIYKQGCYSPVYVQPNQVESSLTIYTQEEVDHRLEQRRLEFLDNIQEDNCMSQDEMRMRCDARKEEFSDEAEFSVEVSINFSSLNSLQFSTDKYRPRKPRYFNRVHTGFEWNKYNQTHYDMDNPPPKIVQGYKFNIFYPDLIDKSLTPAYYLSQCEDNPDFAVLRFHAGPPYEDIAFKIVNREWEFSYKRGFRCQFHNNIFQLWFHFKRYRYRR